MAVQASSLRWLLAAVFLGVAVRADPDPGENRGIGREGVAPIALAVVEGTPPTLWIAGSASREILIVDAESGAITGRVGVPGAPSGLAVAPDGRWVWVTCAGSASQVCAIDVSQRRVDFVLRAGHSAMAPVPSPDGREVYVCERFQNDVAVWELGSRQLAARIPVSREPVAAAITPDGRRLFVANHLHATRADAAVVAAVVSVIDVRGRKVEKELQLPHGSGLLLGIAVSPDGRRVAVTHNLARANLPTTQVDRGWMNTAALTLVDAHRLEVIGTVLLDSADRGAANPWAVAWTADGNRLLATHAGTHELSVLDVPGLLTRLEARVRSETAGAGMGGGGVSPAATLAADDLAFLVGLRERVSLPGRGPRSLAVRGGRVWVGEYFSDALDRFDLGPATGRVTSLALAGEVSMSPVRRGEMYFNDATLSFQGWQSCATCHSYDGRVDGLNWDLLNDGIGNPKNNKSLLWSHRTPPSMSEGVRETAEQAVRAGIRHILFTVQPEEVAASMDAYLKALVPEASPFLVEGRLSPAARRGQAIFNDPDIGCGGCHPPGLFTDLNAYDVGTRCRSDRTNAFDTPTLVELWRTAPYLHDGSALSLQEVLTTRNREDRHGHTTSLSPAQVDDLVAYLLSL